jgi:glycine/D-amino acid oxidase-like deaminating enzyme
MAAINSLEEPKVERVDTCEAVVVGAGLVGAAVVANLAAEDLDVAVLEARDAVGGAFSYTDGLVFTGLPMLYAQVVKQHGRETAKKLWQLTVDNRASLMSAADRLGVKVERTGSLLLAADTGEADLLKQSAAMLSADGFEVYFEDADHLDRGFAAALHRPDDLIVDTAALTKRLLDANRVPLHTGTEVYGLRQEGDDILVMARGRAVRTSTVVLAVNAYAPLIDNYFADKIAPVRGVTLITHPMKAGLIPTPGSSGLFSFHQTSDSCLRFSVWPRDYRTPAAGPHDESYEVDLMRFVGRHFPEATERFARRESSVMGVSRDALPVIGALPDLPQVFFAVGFAGYGLSLAFAAADLLTTFIVRGAEPELLSARRLE